MRGNATAHRDKGGKRRDEAGSGLHRLAKLCCANARYFCQVRFLWRLARSCLRRLCLLILDFRRFFNEPIYGFRPATDSALQYTTLFSGYSIIPSAPAAFNWGINSRTICSSMIVSTATQPSWLRLEMVGRRRAGKDSSKDLRFFCAMFILSPTLASASKAPFKSNAIVSIFWRFHLSFQDV